MSANPARSLENRLRQSQEEMIKIYETNHMNELKKYSAILQEKQKFDKLLEEVGKELSNPMNEGKQKEFDKLLTDMEKENSRLNEAIRKATMEVNRAWKIYLNYSEHVKKVKQAEEWKREAERRFLGRGGATRRRRTKRRGTLKSKKLR